MSDIARQNILNRLKNKESSSVVEEGRPVELPPVVPEEQDVETKVQQLKSMLEAVRTEVYLLSEGTLINQLVEIVKAKNIQKWVYAPDSKLGKLLQKDWPQNNETLFIPYHNEIEVFKEELFHIDAGITSTYGGIAETGSLVLWPTIEEPRLLSLVPPIHIAILEKEQIFHNLREMMITQSWHQEMPTNVLLISGPSKTGDIELKLEYGVHGPKELVVLII